MLSMATSAGPIRRCVLEPRSRIIAKFKGNEAIRPALALTGTGEQPSETRTGTSPNKGRSVKHGGAYVEEGLPCRPIPAHLLRLVHALGDDLVDRTLHERG